MMSGSERFRGTARDFVALGVGERDLYGVAVPAAALAVLVRVIDHLDPDICRQ